MKRAVRMILRLIAAGILIVGAMTMGLQLMLQLKHRGEPSMTRVLLGGLGVVLGLVLFAASSSLAERLTDDFDE